MILTNNKYNCPPDERHGFRRSKCLRSRVRTLCICLLACAGHDVFAQASTSDIAAAVLEVESGMEQFHMGDYRQARRTLNRVIDSDVFSQLLAPVRSDAQYFAALAALESDRPALAYREFRSHTLLASAGPLVWQGRAISAYRDNELGDAVESLTTLALRWPDFVSQTYSEEFFDILAASKEDIDDPEPHLRLATALVDCGWMGAEPRALSILLRDYALEMIERDMPEAAIRATDLIADRSELVRAHLDPRFDVLRELRQEPFAISDVAEREIAAWRAHLDANPRQLDSVISLASAYRHNNQFEAALAEIDRVLAEKFSADDWDDFAESVNWLLNERAWVLRDMGLFDIAIDDMESAYGISRDVSQQLNLGLLYVNSGRVEDAYSILPTSDRVSEYGWAVARIIGVYGAIQEGDDSALEKILAAMARSGPEGLSHYQLALIVSEKTEQAIALLSQRLEDSEQRAEALLAMQNVESNRRRTPFEQEMQDRVVAFYERADVQSLVAQYGQIHTYPFRL